MAACGGNSRDQASSPSSPLNGVVSNRPVGCQAWQRHCESAEDHQLWLHSLDLESTYYDGRRRLASFQDSMTCTTCIVCRQGRSCATGHNILQELRMARVLEKCNTGWIFWDVVSSDRVAIRGEFSKGTIVSLQQT